MSARDFHQKIIKKKNQKRIVELINLGEKSFGDLLDLLKKSNSPLSHTTLSNHLNELQENHIIEKNFLKRKEVYKLSKKGRMTLSDIINLSRDVDRIRSRNGKHFRDYSHLWGSIISSRLSWGIESDLTLDKNLNESNLFSNDDVCNIEEFVFNIIANNIKKRKPNGEQSGEIVLGFKINYNELIKSINEDSLAYYENISKKESDILYKMEEGKDITNQEFNQWKKLRKETYAKIKKRRTN